MKIVVCVRQGIDGELNPFDASAYECALSVPESEVILLSMGPLPVDDLLRRLTRLGANRAILLSDPAFAGADTLATAYTLSLAIRILDPDLIICGRQTLIGDTGQTGPMLAQFVGMSYVSEILSPCGDEWLTRSGKIKVTPPALLTVEKQAILRLPSLRSLEMVPEIWDAKALDADRSRCGLAGSPTRVLQTFENASGRRKCRWILPEQLDEVLSVAETKEPSCETVSQHCAAEALASVVCVGESVLQDAKTVCPGPMVVPVLDAGSLAKLFRQMNPDAVLFGNDAKSKELAARVAVILQTGLCADCTALACEDGRLVMYRPASSGRLIAKVGTQRKPAMATMKNQSGTQGILTVAAGYGVRQMLPEVMQFAKQLQADFAVSRKLVDQGYAPYSMQVGLTGKTVCPRVYLAIGISGAIHHIVGMDRSGTVIAVNPDPEAPVFQYADYGIQCDFSDLIRALGNK